MECSFSPDFLSDSSELSPSTQDRVAGDGALPESNTREPEVLGTASVLEVRAFTLDSSFESISVNAPSVTNW